MKPKFGKKNCSAGANCKGSCISRDKNCIIELKPAQKLSLMAAVKKLIKQAQNFLDNRPGKILGKGMAGSVALNKNGSVTKTYSNRFADIPTPAIIAREAKYQKEVATLGFAPKVLKVTDNSIIMARAAGSPVAKLKLTAVEKAVLDSAKFQALKAMHKKGLAHNDLHGQNEFWDKATKTYTIIDFGLANKDPKNILDEYMRLKPKNAPAFTDPKQYLQSL